MAPHFPAALMKAMIFIDGTWLITNARLLAQTLRQDNYFFDYRKLPEVLMTELQERFDHEVYGGRKVLHLAGTSFFHSYPVNFDPVDQPFADQKKRLYDFLTKSGYNLRAFPINYEGRRIRFQDRNINDPFKPKEKRVDVAIAVAMLKHAPNYDLGLLITGDLDLLPALEEIRSMGRDVALASIHGVCSNELIAPENGILSHLLWLDDVKLAREMELTRMPFTGDHFQKDAPLSQSLLKPEQIKPIVTPEEQTPQFLAEEPAELKSALFPELTEETPEAEPIFEDTGIVETPPRESSPDANDLPEKTSRKKNGSAKKRLPPSVNKWTPEQLALKSHFFLGEIIQEGKVGNDKPWKVRTSQGERAFYSGTIAETKGKGKLNPRAVSLGAQVVVKVKSDGGIAAVYNPKVFEK